MFKTVKRIIDWCGEYKKRLYIGFILYFFSTFFAAAPIMLTAYILGKIIEDVKGISKFNNNWIWFSFLLISLFIFLRFILDFYIAKFQESISYELAARDRLEIGYILKRVSLGYFRENNTSDIVNAITTGLNTLENMGIRMINTFVGGYIKCICIFLCLAVFNLYVSLIAIVGVLISYLFLLGISRHSTNNAPVARAANRDMAKAAIEYARGLPVVKSFGQGGVSAKSMKNACADSKKINIKIELGFTPNNCGHIFALKVASVGLVAAISYFTLIEEIEIPIMILFCLFSFIIFREVEAISDSAHVLGVIEESMNQIESLKKEKFIDEKGQYINLDNYNIEFKNVSFSYDTIEVIKDVSFSIKENTTTAIVGPSGSGKTTICNLIARFYDVNNGEILIGGHNIKEFSYDSLMSNISMVFQDVYLFNDTIRKNICFGKPDATEEEMINAAKKACCHEFIMELPDGYDTVIGEGGSTLSGGEKQRISIARAILKDSPIVILDEATASVDPENEHLIQSAISELTYGKTIIIIAHRLATIENADQILVINAGKIVEKGKHTELIQQNGIYKKFVDIRKIAEAWSI